MVRAVAFTLCLSCAALPAAAQTPASMSASLRGMWDLVKANLSDAAEQMPEGEYAFKPTPDIRSFAELMGHVANANFFFCSQAKGEASPSKTNYEKATSKAEIVKGVKAAVAYCDAAYTAATDATLAQVLEVQLPGGTPTTPRGAVLMFNVAHDNEHYGNAVTYMRLKGHVPPSTARAQAPKK
jgi:uncharacterized damage-inducible protein DinB